eukprot:GILJ01002064.1.p1 GENE.GILJ01002064.1~~GILJ01002064.1.p1  ORF type:complete len:386 (-),score=81.64 GILJ01002064.1:806-1963(-)
MVDKSLWNQISRLNPLAKRNKAANKVTAVGLQKSMSSEQLMGFTCYDYNATAYEVSNPADLSKLTDMPSWATVRWINVEGAHVPTIRGLGEKYAIDKTAIEDILHVPDRAKVVVYEKLKAVLVAAKMIMLDAENPSADSEKEQVCMYVAGNVLLTFQDGKPGDVWDPVRRSIERANSRVRSGDVGFLFYALLDAVSDACFPVVDQLGAFLEDIEMTMMDNPTGRLNKQAHQAKRELKLIRRIMWPMQEVIRKLNNMEIPGADAQTFSLNSTSNRNYLQDVSETLRHLIEMIDTYVETAESLAALWQEKLSSKMNKVMYVLTVVSAVFIPLTFIAGVYGMNFVDIPELRWELGYMYVWLLFVGIAAFVLGLFWHAGIFESDRVKEE